jgi:hypothetical protein
MEILSAESAFGLKKEYFDIKGLSAHNLIRGGAWGASTFVR